MGKWRKIFWILLMQRRTNRTNNNELPRQMLNIHPWSPELKEKPIGMCCIYYNSVVSCTPWMWGSLIIQSVGVKKENGKHKRFWKLLAQDPNHYSPTNEAKSKHCVSVIWKRKPEPIEFECNEYRSKKTYSKMTSCFTYWYWNKPNWFGSIPYEKLFHSNIQLGTLWHW
jgi:hypothetical protein